MPRPSFCFLLFIVFLSLVTLVGLRLTDLTLNTLGSKTERIRALSSTDDTKFQPGNVVEKNSPTCKSCGDHMNEMLKNYSLHWAKNKENHKNLRSELINSCNGFQKAFMTQANSPLGSTIVYDADNFTRTITEEHFNNFPKDIPFSNKILDTCAVVGNGGILANSSCGEAIDSAQFVIRCNIPPLGNGYSKDVGKKTSLVTANMSIFVKRYNLLEENRRIFAEHLNIYGDSFLFLPAFSYYFNTFISLRVHYTLEDFRSPVKTAFMNPDYLRDLDQFWRSHGLDPGLRMSTGLMMVSFALEICNNVEVFGFWPFDRHPYGLQPLNNHYYDNVKPMRRVHSMPVEIGLLLNLHNQGVLRLHLEKCPSP